MIKNVMIATACILLCLAVVALSWALFLVPGYVLAHVQEFSTLSVMISATWYGIIGTLLFWCAIDEKSPRSMLAQEYLRTMAEQAEREKRRSETAYMRVIVFHRF